MGQDHEDAGVKQVLNQDKWLQLIDMYFKSFLLQGILNVNFNFLICLFDLGHLLLMGVVVGLQLLVFILLGLGYLFGQVTYVFVQFQTLFLEFSNLSLLR